jgi:2-C-methyl-D-erythritol 2,4-cyclodiphosphate synthase
MVSLQHNNNLAGGEKISLLLNPLLCFKIFSMYMVKTGIGFDVHSFATGRALIIGGVNIPYEFGLLGHSDADVLAHAITDALVGVTLGKDIGRLFPDNDIKYKGADSLLLLREAVRQIKAENYTIVNVDAVIIAQAPKMSPHIDSMRVNLATAMEISASEVSIKATTTEYLGFTGRKEGIAAVAVANVWRQGGS